MTDINLLPQELKPKSYAIKVSKGLRKVALYFLVVFLIVLMVMGVTYFGLNFRLGSLTKVQRGLESRVNNLQDSEQKLVLIKDRLGKIDTILGSEEAKTDLSTIDLISKNLPDQVVITSVQVAGGTTSVGIGANSSQDLSRFFSILFSLNFKRVLLTSFFYTKDTGYRVEVQISV